MHTDDQKKFDKRNLLSNLQRGLLTQKELESYFSKLPDASNKLFNTEEDTENSPQNEPKVNDETTSRKKDGKKEVKSK
jgi:hypothetical protein